MRLLVTGAAGFIGMHVIGQLMERHAALRVERIVGLDNYNDYYQREAKYMRHGDLHRRFSGMAHSRGGGSSGNGDEKQKQQKRPVMGAQEEGSAPPSPPPPPPGLSHFEIVRGDVCDQVLLRELFHVHRFTHVVHLASQAGVRYSIQNPQEYIRSNILCQVQLFEAVKEYHHNLTLDGSSSSDHQVRIVLASSSSVYGNNRKVPFSEEDRTDDPANVYGASKRMQELLATSYHSLFGFHVTSLRFFTVIGEFGRPDMALFKFVNLIAEDKEIPVYQLFDSDGQEIELMRDFTYVGDIADGVIRSLLYGAKKEVFNLGNNRPQRLTKMIHLIEHEMGTRAKLRYEALPRADIPVTMANITHAQQVIGYSPDVALEEVVKRFVRWYRETYFPEEIIMTTYISTVMDPQRQDYVDTDNFDKMRKWYESVHRHNLHAIVFHDNLSDDFVLQHTTSHVRFKKISLTKRYSANDERFMIYRQHLKEILSRTSVAHWSPKRVLFTDLFDVVFNSDPFIIMKQRLEAEEVLVLEKTCRSGLLFVGSEGTTIAEHKWIPKRLEQCGLSGHMGALEQLLPLNAGIVGGDIDIVMHLLEEMGKRFIENVNCNTPVLNVAMYEHFRDCMVTGAPLHSPFGEENTSLAFHIKHK